MAESDLYLREQLEEAAKPRGFSSAAERKAHDTARAAEAAEQFEPIGDITRSVRKASS